MSKRSFFARAVVVAFATCMLAATPALARDPARFDISCLLEVDSGER